MKPVGLSWLRVKRKGSGRNKLIEVCLVGEVFESDRDLDWPEKKASLNLRTAKVVCNFPKFLWKVGQVFKQAGIFLEKIPENLAKRSKKTS